jgi:hypothetical protein
MHVTKFFTIMIFSALTMNCCISHRNSNKDFVNKYFNESFENFKNKGVVVRGYDNERNPMLFISIDLEKASENGPYIVTIDSKESTIKKTSCHLMKDSINIDRNALDQLAMEFLKYHVQLLRVDKAGNVYVSLSTNEWPTLIRFSNEKYITETYENDWKKIKSNWFERQ